MSLNTPMNPNSPRVTPPTTTQRATKNSKGKSGSKKASPPPTPTLPNCLLVVGFHPDETAALQQHMRATHPDWHVAPILHADLQCEMAQVLQQCAQGKLHPKHKESDVVLGVGRIVLCSGQGVLNRLFDVQMMMEDDENDDVPPPMFGVVEDGDAEGTVGQRLEAVRTAFGQVHGLVVPLGGAAVEDPDQDARIASTRCVLHATMDAAEVPSCSGAGPRNDSSRVLALDGLLSEQECHALLCWVLGEKVPEGPDVVIEPAQLRTNWEQRCVDYPGAPPSWGLTQNTLQSLIDDPPRPVILLQQRLQALYPEYSIALMPGAGLADESEEEDEAGGVAAPLSSFVGNAVVNGQHCAWHQDMDPACLPPMSPWVQQHSWYYNREPGKPLFVSMLLYLNPSWAPEWQAETLFVDPDSGTGVFVQPRPGRVVLMDQDVPHRIGAPSIAAGTQPRFSLVWKLVFWPKQDYAQGLATGVLQEMSIAKKQWGPAVHLGALP